MMYPQNISGPLPLPVGTCPNCRGSNTSRLPVLFQSGINMVQGAGIVSGVGVQMVGGLQQSAHSIAAAPPSKPVFSNSKAVASGLALLVIGLFSCLGMVIFSDSGKHIGYLILGGALLIGFIAAGVAAFVFINRKLEEEHNADLSKWQIVFHQWERTWQCLQCGHRWFV